MQRVQKLYKKHQKRNYPSFQIFRIYAKVSKEYSFWLSFNLSLKQIKYTIIHYCYCLIYYFIADTFYIYNNFKSFLSSQIPCPLLSAFAEHYSAMAPNLQTITFNKLKTVVCMFQDQVPSWEVTQEIMRKKKKKKRISQVVNLRCS